MHPYIRARTSAPFKLFHGEIQVDWAGVILRTQPLNFFKYRDSNSINIIITINATAPSKPGRNQTELNATFFVCVKFYNVFPKRERRNRNLLPFIELCCQLLEERVNAFFSLLRSLPLKAMQTQAICLALEKKNKQVILLLIKCYLPFELQVSFFFFYTYTVHI